jgi:aminopeptidase
MRTLPATLPWGKAYPTCVRGGTDMDKQQLSAAGANDSLIHVDFMVGSEDLSMTGIHKDGSGTPVFINRNFATPEHPASYKVSLIRT